MTQAFYKGKRVLVTGHTGFKGSWLSIWLNMLGADVTGFAMEPPTNPAMFDICGVGSKVNSIIGDVRDKETIAGVLNKFEPEIIFHLAAQPIVRLSYENPVETYEINVMGTVNLLEAIRNTPSAKSVVIITSDKCYENRESFWGYRETDRLGGYDPYSNSKACQELITSAFSSSFFNPVEYGKHGVAIASARAGNVIGGGDFAKDRLVPDIIRCIINKEQLSIRNPGAIRPWQHVLEPLNGYMTLAEKLYTEGTSYSGAWNFGPDNNNIRSVDWIVRNFFELLNLNYTYMVDAENNPHETKCLKLDSYKAQQLLGFKPIFNIEKTIEITAQWYKAYFDKRDMHNFTIEQICEYENVKSQDF